jgi:ADP-heptose:LPS heptosyltransferase
MPLGAALGLSIGGRLVDTVLIFRIGSLGDTIVALPCFHRIAQSFPDARRIMVTDRPISSKMASVESVLGQSGLIDSTIYFPAPPRRLGDFLALRAQIKATGATTLVYVADRGLAATVRDVLFFYASGIRRIIGAPLRRDLRNLRVDPESGHTEREAERLARCLAPLGAIDLDDPSAWDLRLQPAEMRAADAALAPLRGRKFIALSVGGRQEAKDWGNENWSALLQLLGNRYADFALVFFGAADEAERSAKMAAQWPGPVLNLCGRLGPRESAAAIAQASLYIGHDSGPLHLAAAVGVACVAMFGPVNMPKWWHPMGAQHRIIHDMRGVKAITPPQVFAAVEEKVSALAGERDRRNSA